ncbi:hypothetical protein [Nocardioides soli]|uniref:AbiEi antitoxin C-terminal domain-containing protein n=1 Tax=Nocardioides soli TaxID=1036020 RepID=A0A7W4YZW2_9ACTN|nr:hypothetical protein [Nocardioides soli]MBB3041342.1 hypothetical protein [Nocardioides soli]
MVLRITRPGVVVPVRVDPAGVAGPTRGQARGPRWRAVGGGLHVLEAADPEQVEQRIVEAVAGCGPMASATGWAGLAWLGSRWLRGLGPDGRTRLPVPVGLGDQRVVRSRPGVRIAEDWLLGGDVIEVDGLPITIAERSVSFEARRAGTLTRAVQVIDMAAADDLVSIASLTTYAGRLSGRPGIRRLRAALSLAEENVWSIQEVPMRLEWRLALPTARVLCNAPIFDPDGRHLITPDLFDPVAGVAGEYDGAIHLHEGPRRRDLDRDALYRDLRIEVVTRMSGNTADTAAFLGRLRACYRRSTDHRARARRWTLEQPDWWVDTSTVARRRALDEAERAIWLRYRRAS